MATQAQITANRLNAQRSTGPVTSEGKSRSSQNAAKSGLFAKHDFVPPDCRAEYETLRERLIEQLRPADLAETVLVTEIISASWRLQRCGQMEALLDPDITGIGHLPVFQSIDRARAGAERSFSRALATLRKIQTESRSRRDDIDFDDLGLAAIAEVARAHNLRAQVGARDLKRRAARLQRELEKTAPEPEDFDSQKTPDSHNEPDSPPTPISIPRNAPCPCGSGEKYKRCCGVSAPPVLMNPRPSRPIAA